MVIKLKKVTKQYHYGIVYVPELKDEMPVFKTKDEQVSWERDCYINSNVILFWVPRKFPSMLG